MPILMQMALVESYMVLDHLVNIYYCKLSVLGPCRFAHNSLSAIEKNAPIYFVCKTGMLRWHTLRVF